MLRRIVIDTIVSSVRKKLSRHIPLMVLIFSLAIAFVLRYSAVRQHLDMGQDLANYLVTMQQVFGHDPGGMGLLRPPLIAFPLKLFTLAFGTLHGDKALGVLTSVAIGVPFYLLARRVCHPWIAVAVSIMFVFSSAYSDMLSWGYITFTGIFFILLTIHFLLLVLEKPSKGNVILTGLCASLIVGFHQFSFAYFIALMVVFLFALLLFNRKKLFQSYKHLAAVTVIAGILSLPYVFIYMHLARMMQVSRGDTSSFISIAPLDQTETCLRGLCWFLGPWFWCIVFTLVITGMIFLWRQDRNKALLLAVMLSLPVLLTVFVLPPPLIELSRRAYYFAYIPIWLLAGVALSRLWLWQNFRLSGLIRWLPQVTAIVLIVALLPWGIVSAQERLHDELGYYTYLDDTRWQAVHWISQNTDPGATIAVYPYHLGWWIRGEAERNTFELIDRNEAAYTYVQEHSWVTDQILSRNQGLENGNLRLAMTYPYDNETTGSPVIGVYAGGIYHDVLMFDDYQSYIQVEGGDKISLADAQTKEMNITGGDESMQAVTLYSMNGFEVAQMITLNQGEQATTICYRIDPGNANISRFDVPVFFNLQEISDLISMDEHSFEVEQDITTTFEGVVSVTTNISVDTEGATLENLEVQGQQVLASFAMGQNEATIIFHFSVTTPQLKGNVPVSHYIVPELLKDYGVNYVVVDFKPHTPWLNDIPRETETWLNNCPYYKLVYQQGDIMIYQVKTPSP